MARTVTDLADWLNGLDLDRYVQTFVENHVEYTTLSDLTENDLKNLGVSLGHRKRMLKAIDAMAARDESDKSSVSNIKIGALPRLQRREAELRQITVMFCDLVGSTQLSGKVEPEDLQIILEAYRNACSAAISRYDGRVAGNLGDGVMAYFGWPRAHEDDAVRAVYAALEILPAVTKIPAPITLAVRIGVCSGPAVVGEVGSGATAGLMDAVGETPNVAARLQTLAAPNTVLIAQSTKRLLSAAFDLQDLGLQELKGVIKPLNVYRVLAAKNSPSRFEAAHAGSLTPLVGRSTELNLLLDRWQKAKEADGQIVLISGIAGVGKSRLIHEFKLNIRDEPHFLLNYQCSPYHNQSAFFPIAEQIEQGAQIISADSEAVKINKISEYLSALGDESIESALLIGTILSIPTENHPELSYLSAQQRKNRTLTTLLDRIITSSSRRPTVCIFEDVHWIDPSTLELLELAISRVEHSHVLLIVSHRPEFRHTWFTYSNVTTHSLIRLSRSEVAEMIGDLLRGASVPINQQLIDHVIEKGEGVPLFVEELTSSALIASMQSQLRENNFESTSQPLILKVPDTLHDALMERLDRVPQGRALAQIAAVIGREFSYDLLSVALRASEDELSLAVSMLEEADIIYRVGISPYIRFAFKHVLLRDAIYNSLLRNRRRQIHANIAEILGRLEENRPEIVAYHHNEAGNHELAVRGWFESGRRALRHSANVEAIAHYRKALESLGVLPDTPARINQEIEIQLALGIPLIAVRGYAAVETRDAFARALSLCVTLDNSHDYFQALYGLWGHSWMSGKNDEAMKMADEFLSRSEALGDSDLLMVAHRTMGSTLLTIGEFQSAKQHFEKTISLSGREEKQSLYDLYMVEPQVASLLLLSWDLWFLGYPDQSLSRVSEGLATALNLVQPYSIAFAHYMASVVHLLRGDPALALTSAEASLEISKEQRFSLYVLLSNISRGRALGELGRMEEARKEMKLGIDQARNEGVGYMRPMMESWLADIYARSGEIETALSIVEQTLADIDNSPSRSWESELHRQKAQTLLALTPARAQEADSHFREAIAVARRQGAKSLELRAVTSLAEVLQAQERSDEARELLETILGWFKEGAGTVDHRRARDLSSLCAKSTFFG